MAVLTRYKISTIVSNISLVTNQPTLINDCIQIALNRLYQAHDWPYYMVDGGVLNTVALYDTGTAAIANGSTTVTIATGVVSNNFLYRKFRIENDTPWYRIVGVSTGANTLPSMLRIRELPQQLLPTKSSKTNML